MTTEPKKIGAFVRHGQTQHNVDHRLTGHLDVPLTEVGKEQARETANSITDEYQVIYCSDLLRCRETAAIINEGRNLTINYDARLRERDFGSLCGKLWSEIDPTGEVWERELAQNYDYTEFGGESVAQVEDRLITCLREIREKNVGTPLIVTHAGIIRMMYARSGEPQEFITNASVAKFELPV